MRKERRKMIYQQTMTSRTYYTIEDMVDASLHLKFQAVPSNVSVASIANGLGIMTVPTSLSTAANDPYSVQMFYLFIIRNWKQYVCYADDVIADNEVVSHDDMKEKMNEWCQRALAYFLRTLPKRKAILDLYNAKKTHLLDPVHSSTLSTNKVNDMPVSPVDVQDHLSNLSTVEGVNDDDGATTIARIDEVSRLYNDELELWEDDFSSNFTFDMVD